MANRFGKFGIPMAFARVVIAAVLCCMISACGLAKQNKGVDPISMGPSTLPSGQTLTPGSGWLLPAGNYHLMTTRSVSSDSQPQILCTEPSPDWAVAFGEALQLSAAATAPSGIGASIGGSYSDTESVTALVGRTAGVVALRDGLYSACQAYANHIIGKDAYALILSQYGDLLVALAGATTGAAQAGGTGGAATSATPATPAGVAVAVSTGSATGTSSAGTPSKPATTASSQDSQAVAMQMETLQALLTVCLTDSDPTEKEPDQRNLLLASPSVCEPLLKNVADASMNLLKPQAGGSSGTNNAPNAGGDNAAASDPAILALQLKLNKAGANLTPDGVYGQKTKSAMLKYPDAL